MCEVKEKYLEIVNYITNVTGVTNKNIFYQFLLISGELNEECFNRILDKEEIFSSFLNESISYEKIKNILILVRNSYRDMKETEGFDYEIMYDKNKKLVEFVKKE